MVEYDIVDLGTKKGNAIQEFLVKAGKTVLPASTISAMKPENCIGFERSEGSQYRSDVEGKGYKFDILDLNELSDKFSFPSASVYLAWHILEHLKDKSVAAQVTRLAFKAAKVLAWFRLPSFQPDDVTGEGVLAKHDLRFTWTNWHGHPTPWLVEDACDAIKHAGGSNIKVKPADYITSVSDKRVVPVDAPVDTVKYTPSLGEKPDISFDRPIVAAWDVIAYK